MAKRFRVKYRISPMGGEYKWKYTPDTFGRFKAWKVAEALHLAGWGQVAIVEEKKDGSRE